MEKRKILKVLLSSLLLFSFFSCQSMTKSSAGAATSGEATSSMTNKNVSENTTESQDTASLSNLRKAFLKNLETIELKLLSQPSHTIEGKAFATPYVISVTQNGKPLQAFSMTVSYPASKAKDKITFASEILVSDDKGIVYYTPQVPAFPVEAKISFYPTPVNSDSKVKKAVAEKTVQTDWKVRSSKIARPSIIYVFDYDANGRAGSNSFAMLKTMRNSGFAIGNGPISDSSYINRPLADLYRATKSMAGDTFEFLVSGTVKFVAPITQTANGYSCSLVADITCMSMKNGEVLFSAKVENTEVDGTEQNALSKCRSNLASKVTNILIYSL